MAHINITLIKFIVLLFASISVKKPTFKTAISQCYSINFQQLIEVPDPLLLSSIWVYKEQNRIFVRPNHFLKMLLILCGDVELMLKGPDCVIPKLRNILRNKGLKMLHQNIRGLFNKKDIEAEILLDHDIGLLCLTETFLPKDIPSSHLNILGYHFEEKRRDEVQGGGVGIYINESLNYVRRNDLEIKNFECLFIEICFPFSKSFIVGVLYRPPDSSLHLSKDFNTDLDKTITSLNKEIIILGDLNCDYMKKSDHKEIKEIFTRIG